MKVLCGLLVYLIAVHFSETQQNIPSLTLNIGVLMDTEDPDERQAYEFAIQTVNRDTRTLSNTKLALNLKEVDDILNVSRSVCALSAEIPHNSNSSVMRPGVAAIFGPWTQASVDFVGSFAYEFRLPHIQIQPDYQVNDDTDPERGKTLWNGINFYPHTEILSEAFREFVFTMQWRRVVILSDSPQDLTLLKRVMKRKTTDSFAKDVRILDLTKGYRKALVQLKLLDDAKNLIVHMHVSKVKSFLEAAQELGLLSGYRNYMFTTLDLATISDEISPLTTGLVNITAYQLVVRPSEKNGKIQNMKEKWDDLRMPSWKFEKMLQTKNALIYDSVWYLANRLHDMQLAEKNFKTEAMRCSHNDEATRVPWKFGQDLSAKLVNNDQSYDQGVTGNIRIDNDGRRRNFELQLIEFDSNGEMKELGTYIDSSLKITKTWDKTKDAILRDMATRNWTIVIKPKEPPFAEVNEDLPKTDPNRYHGYCIDMWKLIAEELNITSYKFMEQTAGSRRQLDGSWTGIMSDIVHQRADFGLTPLTVTSDRALDVQFSEPYMQLGISILFQKPVEKPINPFSFLDPFHDYVWIILCSAIVGTTFILFCVGRFSPGQWDNPHPCHPDVDLLENDLTPSNSLWFVLGSFLQQGTEIMPKSPPTRVIAAAWWLFCLICVASYTANLAAFLTKSKMKSPIANAADLAKQSKIQYGCFGSGSTRDFFAKSNEPTYIKMNNYMKQNTHLLLSTSEGKEKVKMGNYAYIMESMPLRYELTKDCSLTEIGSEMSDSFYALAFPKGSPYTDFFSEKILQLREKQKLMLLYNKHWKINNGPCKVCDPDNSSSLFITNFITQQVQKNKCLSDKPKSKVEAMKLGLPNFAGVFIILYALLASAAVACLVNFFSTVMMNAVKRKRPIGTELKNEIKFNAFCCGDDEKPVDLSETHTHNDDSYEDLSLGRSRMGSLSMSLGSLKTLPSTRNPHSLDITRETHMTDSEDSLDTVLRRH